MNTLVLGGAGFIGSHVVDALVQCGDRVRVFDRPNVDTRNLATSLPNIEFYRGEFTNKDDVAAALVGIDVIVHLLSATTPSSSNEHPVYDVEANISGTVRLLAMAKDAGVKKIVFASSGGTVYGSPMQLPIPETHPNNPICSYGITKLTIEKYLYLFHRLHGLDYSILRIANPYGERQNPRGGLGAITVFLWKLVNDEPITIWGTGEIARDYFYISDLTSAFVKVIHGTPGSRIYNVGGGRAYSLNEILATMQGVTGKVAKVLYMPARKLDVSVNYLDITLAENELSWRPTVTLEQGISKTLTALDKTQRM